MNDVRVADAPRLWQSDRAKFLDSKEFINATVRILKGALPGTGKVYDAQKVADELLEMLFAELRDQIGISAETALATLGALAGFSVQMALRETIVKAEKLPEDKAFVVLTTNGKTFYLGDLLNEVLFENRPGNLSVYSLVALGAQKAGAKQLPDIAEIAQYVAGTMGSELFGVPRMPSRLVLRAQPLALLNKFWNPVRNYLAVSTEAPHHWPLVLALASQKVIFKSKDTVDPLVAAQLFMETAIAMAKVDPARIHFASFQTY